jgi:hypothetical protein
MIRLPQRSVTRFFIPLIDVLTLLFCIFLLMPMIKTPGEEPIPRPAGPDVIGDAAGAEKRSDSAGPEEKPKNDLDKEREELKRLQHERIEALQQRLALRVLEIDADTGKLYYHEPEQRVELTSEADAHALIARHRREAVGRELYYLILYPRRVTGYPEQKQIQQYERWFENVAHGIDNPRASR